LARGSCLGHACWQLAKKGSPQLKSEEARQILAPGPQAITREKRRANAEDLASRLDRAFGRSVIAIGLYGSTGREADREFSDTEMFCVLDEIGENRRLEWVDAGGKYEVELFGEDVVRRKASELDEAWPVTHAVFANPRRLRGDVKFFAELRRLVFDHTQSQFDEVIRNIIVGELFEALGKVRNSMLHRTFESLPRVVTRVAIMAELMVGLSHRTIYTSSGLATEESMKLTPRPTGHDKLCAMIMRGELSDPERISLVMEQYWKGVIQWAAARNLELAAACNSPFWE
jgi:kanamycin nucleotidyltransferase